LLLVAAGLKPALIVALAWGIGVALHWLFAVAAPILRQRAKSSAPPSVAGPRVNPRAQERARSLEELSAAIAHEIRSPITAAKSLVQQIAEDPSAPENVEHARVAVEELDRVERSIGHLLRFAREEPFEPVAQELAALIESALELVRERGEREQIQIVADLDPLPPVVADGDQLRKLIVNLVGNALDAHAARPRSDDSLSNPPASTRFVRVSAGRNLAGDEVWIRVRDNGPGMSPQVVSKIFQPFYTTRAGRGGTGLGLALAKKVVDRHGGSIEVESREGQGTEFLVLLPRTVGAEP
jgi:signal transduction histidine kinase